MVPARRRRARVAAALLTLVGVLLCRSAAGEPAPWFEWRSKVDGKRVCAQTSLGPGWEKASGPFRDSHCGKSIVAK
jgi:hypothetical protein